ncbi:MAG: hypothetical protein ACE5KE_00590 [Methanosarcinales archaeon]
MPRSIRYLNRISSTKKDTVKKKIMYFLKKNKKGYNICELARNLNIPVSSVKNTIYKGTKFQKPITQEKSIKSTIDPTDGKVYFWYNRKR